MARTMLRTAAACRGVARRGGADTRESKYVAGADDAAPGEWAPRRAACPALAVAVPVAPAIAAAARLMPTGITNRRLRMLPPVVGKDRPAARREPRCGGPAPPTTMPLPILSRYVAEPWISGGTQKGRDVFLLGSGRSPQRALAGRPMESNGGTMPLFSTPQNQDG